MKKLYFSFLLLFAFFSIVTLLPISTSAQDKPSIFNSKPKKDKNDDQILCGGIIIERDVKTGKITRTVSEESTGELSGEKFCTYYANYEVNLETNPAKAAEWRNRMIDLIRVQIDEYYDGHKNGRTAKTKWFQTVLDILGVGLAFSGNIVGGARSKTVLAATAGAFQAGRNAVNDRFQLLQYQILINKMNSNRIDQWEKIVLLKQKPINEFGWDDAKAELQQYLFRGSFNDALDSLVNDTGSEVTEAEKSLSNTLKAISVDKLNDSLLNFKTYIAPLDAEANKLNAEIAAIDGRVKTVETEIAGYDNRINELNAEITAASTDAKKDELRTELQTVEKQKSDAVTKKTPIEKEKAAPEAKLKSLLDTYKNIWQSIRATGKFEIIDEKIRNLYSGKVISDYDTFLDTFKTNPSALTTVQYDQTLTKVNRVVSEDTELNKEFLTILKANTLTTTGDEQ